MKKKPLQLVFTLTFIVVCLSTNAQMSNSFDQLISINTEWATQDDLYINKLKELPTKQLTEIELIQFHLSKTEELLRSKNIANLTPTQKINRLKNLDVLHSYMLAGKFPTNTNHYNRQPYFIDEYNVYCAAGYLMKQSGYDKLATDISKTQNYSYLKDINHPDLMNWIAQSGLTIDELALVQPFYEAPVCQARISEFHYNNAGTDVNEYIEIRQKNPDFQQTENFNTILFYDDAGTLYKTLLIAQMQFPNSGNENKFYNYIFPTNENFADKGKIEVVHDNGNGTSLLIERITYSDVSFTDENFLSPASSNTYNIAENESTVAGYSITYCGSCANATWHPEIQLTTIGTVNGCVVMALELKDFSYKLNNNKTVNLTWDIDPSFKNKSFIVERSNDGITFEKIGIVDASTNSSTYTFIDKNPNYINHYKLKLLEVDNKFTYSKVLYVKVEQASMLTLNQNSITNNLAYYINANSAKNIVVYNIYGQQVFSGLAKAGSSSINTSTWASGKYIIRLFTKTGDFYTQQFIKL